MNKSLSWVFAVIAISILLVIAYTSVVYRKVANRKSFLSTIGTTYRGFYEVHPESNDLGPLREYFGDVRVSRLVVEQADRESLFQEAKTLFPECQDLTIVDVMPKDLTHLPGGMKDRWKNKKPLNANGE